ncbi:ATP-binding protein [Amycolatopsis sp. NPDC051102]|uniref:ATP-binding protein n=1 Tax=Amycolatopsis sp. NPDC051102 TaxID=3155163 RepID=UPI003433C419
MHEYSFAPGGAPDLAAMRTWLRSVLDDETFDAVQDALLMATELVTNAFDHARGARTLRVFCRGPGSPGRLEIDDACPDLELHFDGGAPQGTRGRGLLLIDAISPRWGVTRTGTLKTVWADLAGR